MRFLRFNIILPCVQEPGFSKTLFRVFENENTAFYYYKRRLYGKNESCFIIIVKFKLFEACDIDEMNGKLEQLTGCVPKIIFENEQCICLGRYDGVTAEVNDTDMFVNMILDK